MQARQRVAESTVVFIVTMLGSILVEFHIGHYTFKQVVLARPVDTVIIVINTMFYGPYRSWALGYFPLQQVSWFGRCWTNTVVSVAASVLKNGIYGLGSFYVSHATWGQIRPACLTFLLSSLIGGYLLGEAMDWAKRRVEPLRQYIN